MSDMYLRPGKDSSSVQGGCTSGKQTTHTGNRHAHREYHYIMTVDQKAIQCPTCRKASLDSLICSLGETAQCHGSWSARHVMVDTSRAIARFPSCANLEAGCWQLTRRLYSERLPQAGKYYQDSRGKRRNLRGIERHVCTCSQTASSDIGSPRPRPCTVEQTHYRTFACYHLRRHARGSRALART